MANTKISQLQTLALSSMTGNELLETANVNISSNSISTANMALYTANVMENRYNPFVVSQGGPSANLTFAANVSWNLETIQIATLTLTANANVNAPTGMRFRTHALILNQANGGNWLVTWNPVFKWSNGTPPTLSTANNSKDIITLICDGTNMYGVATTNLA